MQVHDPAISASMKGEKGRTLFPHVEIEDLRLFRFHGQNSSAFRLHTFHGRQYMTTGHDMADLATEATTRPSDRDIAFAIAVLSSKPDELTIHGTRADSKMNTGLTNIQNTYPYYCSTSPAGVERMPSAQLIVTLIGQHTGAPSATGSRQRCRRPKPRL